MSNIIRVATPQIGDEEIAAVSEVLRSGLYVSGPRVEAFENAFADYVGTAHAVATNSGTSALHAALMAAGVGPGDEVVVPALTFFSTVAAVIHQTGIPVFADISLENFCLDPEEFARVVTPRTKAVIPVHYFGHAAEMTEIVRIAGDKGIAVIEDCAQSHGTTYDGAKTGSIGDFGAFSFYASKHMTTGEGGMVTTDDEEAAERIRLFRNHGMKGRHQHAMLGYNYRMTELAAAIGLVQIGKLDDLNARRIRNSEILIERIGDIPWLSVPQVPPHVRHTYFWLHILIDETRLGMGTQDLIGALRRKGIETRNRYLEPLYCQPVLTTNIPPVLKLAAQDGLVDYAALSLPNAEQAAGRVIGLPNRPDMTEDEIDRVATELRQVGG